MTQQRQSSPAADTAWFIFFCLLIVGSIQAGQPLVGVVIGVGLLLLLFGKAAQGGKVQSGSPRATVQRPGPPAYRARCGNCGAPAGYRDRFCMYCGHTLEVRP